MYSTMALDSESVIPVDESSIKGALPVALPGMDFRESGASVGARVCFTSL